MLGVQDLFPKLCQKRKILPSEEVIKCSRDISSQSFRDPNMMMICTQPNVSLHAVRRGPVVVPFNEKGATGSDQENRPSLPKNALFPLKLHAMLDVVEQNGEDHVVSWLSDEKVRHSKFCCKNFACKPMSSLAAFHCCPFVR